LRPIKPHASGSFDGLHEISQRDGEKKLGHLDTTVAAIMKTLDTGLS